jgi:DNA-directed RNA polymerase subunit RPC12/RpoP
LGEEVGEDMPVYVCPKCGRSVEKPEGTYYCSVCGPDVLMVEKGSSSPQVISGSELNIVFRDGRTYIINADTGKETRVPPKHIVKIAGHDIAEAHIHEGGRLIVVYGFPARISIEPYYG